MNSRSIVLRGLLCFSALTGCVKPKQVDALYFADELALKDGPTIRVPILGPSKVRMGQCVDAQYRLHAASCVDKESAAADPPPGPSDLWAGRFRYHSRLVSVEFGSNLAVGGSTGEGHVSVTTHELLIEWSRGSTQHFSGDAVPAKPRPRCKIPARKDANAPAGKDAAPGPATPESVDCGYVWAVEHGIAIQVAFTVKLRSFDAETALSFGFGTLAAALVAGTAEVQVRYNTIGVARDILPDQAPVNVTSIDDLLGVKQALYDAIKNVSKEWNACADATGEPPEDPDACRRRRFSAQPIAYHVLVADEAVARAEEQQRAVIEALGASAQPQKRAD